MLRKPLLRVMTALFAVLIMLGGALVPMSTTPASAADVTAWVELSSTKPGPGCTIAMAIEIRSAGRAISGAEVSIALFDNGSVIGIDTEYTNDNGVAYLGVNAASGADWMDLNIGGAYMKGYSIAVTSGNGCESSPKVETLSGNLNTGLGAASYPPYYIYGQMRRLSCEYASITIATQGAISEYAIEEVVPSSQNPHVGYRGDINGEWGNTTDYGVYAEPLAKGLAEFGYVGDVFYGGNSGIQMMEYLDQGIPVIVWLGLWGDTSFTESSDGSTYTLLPGLHVMVAYAYDEKNVYLSDPGTASLIAYNWSDFRYMYGILDGMSLAVYPA